MELNKTSLERAFELARSGKVATVSDLRSQIRSEGYSVRDIDGPALGRQLRSIIAKARAAG